MKANIKEASLAIKEQLADKFWWFELEFKNDYVFEAGQYVSVRVNKNKDRRSYSIATAPGGKRVGLLVDVAPMGLGSRFFLSLKAGDSVEVLGPLGRFAVGKMRSYEPRIFVATGSGIAPIKAMIEDLLLNQCRDRVIRLVWGLRHERDVFWQKRFEDLEKRHKNFKFELVLSRPGKDWMGKKGRVTDVLRELEVNGDMEFYLCGSSEMVDDCKRILVDKGADEKKIHFEKYG